MIRSRLGSPERVTYGYHPHGAASSVACRRYSVGREMALVAAALVTWQLIRIPLEGVATALRHAHAVLLERVVVLTSSRP